MFLLFNVWSNSIDEDSSSMLFFVRLQKTNVFWNLVCAERNCNDEIPYHVTMLSGTPLSETCRRLHCYSKLMKE